MPTPARRCLACERPDAIKAALLVPGATMRGVARAFGIPKSTLDRHNSEHVKAAPAKRGTAASKAAGAIEAMAAASAGPTRHEVATASAIALAAAPPAASSDVEAPAPTSCSVCADAEHFAIGVAVRQGATYATIATRYGVDLEVLRRHALGCIPALLAQAGDLAARLAPSVVLGKSGGVMADVEKLLQQAQQLVSDAAADPDPRRRAAAITAAKGVVELCAKMRGELAADLEGRLAESEHWTALRDRILNALSDHPEALAAVVAALGQASA
jgi:transposase-like protein